MDEYKKLCDDSVELYRAKKTIDKLSASIEKKDRIIEKMEKEVKFEDLSPVSLQNFQLILK